MKYPKHSHGVPLHPAPLYEALLDIALLVAANAVAFAGARMVFVGFSMHGGEVGRW